MTEATFMGIATIVAIILGPILAVLITRWIDDLRLKHHRRMDLFRTLMRTRRMVLNPEHVSALNLVEIEFHDRPAVLSVWKDYWANLAKAAPTGSSEELQHFIQERDALLAKLLHAIASVVGIKIEQLDIFQGGYIPRGWLDDENQLRTLRLLMTQLLSGQRALPVVPFAAAHVGAPYPPPPPAAASQAEMPG